MLQMSLDDLVQKARALSQKNERWHHHFLTRNCMYNMAGREFQLVLESEEDGKTFVAVSFERPTKWLNEVEDLQMKMNRK